MARVLTRPMFRKGGLSRETGIMSGLDRKGYAQGSYAPRVGYQTGSWYKPWTWGTKPPLTGGSPNVPALYKKPLESRAWEGIKSIVKRGWGMLPEEGLLSKATRAAPVTTGATVTAGLPLAYAYGAKKLQESLPEQLKGEGGIYDVAGYDDPMSAGASVGPEVDEILRGKQINIKGEPLVPKKTETEEKIIKDETNLKKKSDLETIYGDLLPMIERELGADPDDTKRQLYVQLAQAGANLLAQPGGDLVGAIGKATKEPISAVGKVLEKESATDREAKILAFKLAADRASPGEMGKLIQDLKNNNFTQSEINTIIQNRQPGSGYRANVEFEETKELRTELQDEFQKEIGGKKSVPLTTAKDLKFAQDNFGMSISDFKVLPKKEERVPGEYYFNPKDRTLGRLSKDGKTLIKPSEPGFMDQTA